MDDTIAKEARRAAYAAYVECFWSLWHLPSGDARRPALVRATQQAESVWRASMARMMGGAHPGCIPQSNEHGRSQPVSLYLTLDASLSGESLSAGGH